jgi:hypothetical protein
MALTVDIVGNFAASYSDVKAKADELSAEYDVPDGGTATAAWQAWMGVGGAKVELDASVSAHGFADFGAWIQAFSAIARAYAFAKDGGALDNDMAAALEKIKDDPSIPQAQKDMLLQQLQASAGAIASMRPTNSTHTSFHTVGTKRTLDSQGVSYKSCWVADANLDQNRATRHEFCEYGQKFSDLLQISNNHLA